MLGKSRLFRMQSPQPQCQDMAPKQHRGRNAAIQVGFAMPGGAVDLRTTNSGVIRISGTYLVLSSICSSSVRAAISPIFFNGCLTVVSGGVM
jgi:hypothetical protein